MASSARDAARLSHADLRVMVVSHRPFLRRVISDFLNQLGVGDIHYRSDGEHAEEQPLADLHLILSEFDMPHRNGLELLKRVRIGDTCYPAEVPFVFVTGDSDRWVISSALRLDADGYILLPISAQKLEQVIALAVGRARETSGRDDYLGVDTEAPRATLSTAKAVVTPEKALECFANLMNGARMVAVEELAVGMMLGADLVSERGMILLPAATPLSAAVIMRLQQVAGPFGFEQVPVVDGTAEA